MIGAGREARLGVDMAKIYVQNFKQVWVSSASIAGAGTASGSAKSRGYARLVGTIISAGSLAAGSGLRFYQSGDDGENWDYWENNTVSACSGSIFSASICGDAVKVEVIVGANDADEFRTGWWLRPV